MAGKMLPLALLLTGRQLELLTIVLGFVAAGSALFMSFYFARSTDRMARAVSFDKFAEFVNMSVILVFAVSYYFRLFTRMPIEAAAALRIAAIAATFFSSCHLFYQTKKVIEGRNGSNDSGTSR